VLRKVGRREGSIGEAVARGACYAADELFERAGRDYLYRIYAGMPVTGGYTGHWDNHWMHASALWPGWLVSALLWATDTRDPANDTLHQYIDNVSMWPEWGGGVIPSEAVLEVSRRVYGIEAAMDRDQSYVEGKAVAGKWHRDRAMIVNSLPVCDWCYPHLFSWHTMGYGDVTLEAQLFSSCTGVELTSEELDRCGERIWNLERAIESVWYGRTRDWDEEILRSYYWTGRPDMHGERTLDPESFIADILEPYYRLSGWDDRGVPAKAKLIELGLKDVVDVLGPATGDSDAGL
jgi:hypothetical protein